MLIFIIVLVASLILPSCAHVGRGARPNEDAVREFAKTHGIDEDVARFYLNHPEYIKRHYSSPPAYHSRNYRMRTFLMRKYFDMAMEYREAGDLDMAIETLKRVQRLKPDSALDNDTWREEWRDWRYTSCPASRATGRGRGYGACQRLSERRQSGTSPNPKSRLGG